LVKSGGGNNIGVLIPTYLKWDLIATKIMKEKLMAYENMLYEKRDGVARITINRPNVMNAITPGLLSEMKSAVLEAGKDDEVRVIVLTGAGRAFSAGVDLIALGDRKLERGKVGPILDDPARALIEAIQNVPKVVIAMVNGFCITGAMEIVLGCDLIVAAEEAKFGDTHARWGLRPTWGMSQRLPRAVGMLKAKEMSFTADLITGRQAQELGLVNMAVPLDKLEETMQELIRRITVNSMASLAAYKKLYNQGLNETLKNGLEFEAKNEFDITDTEERLAKFRKKD
jgi:enoyl-CoA hydratase